MELVSGGLLSTGATLSSFDIKPLCFIFPSLGTDNAGKGPENYIGELNAPINQYIVFFLVSVILK